jgi:hypothetical protein
MFFSSQEVSMSTSEMFNIVQGLETKRYGYKTLTYILYPNCASTCTLMQKKRDTNYHSHYFFYSKNFTWSKLIPHNILSIEVLNNYQTGQMFVVDIMVVYNTYLDKENKVDALCV